MSGILAQTLPDLPVRTFRFPPNASRQQVMETVFYEYMSEIDANSVRTHGNDSHGVLSVLTSALCLPPRYGDEIRLSGESVTCNILMERGWSSAHENSALSSRGSDIRT